MSIFDYIRQRLSQTQPGTETGLPVPTPDAAKLMASGVAGYGQHVLGGVSDMVNTPRDVMQGTLDPNSPEGMDRINGMAASMVSPGMFGAEAGSAGIFGGRLAVGADKAAADAADTYLQQGYSPKEVHQNTGWFQGADGKTRFEIPDDRATLVPKPFGVVSPAPTTMGGLLDHPDLYQHYPELANTKLDVYKGDSHGYFDPDTPGGPTIGINQNLSPFKQRVVALHELQHAVQAKEGFDGGTSLQGATAKLADLPPGHGVDPYDVYHQTTGEVEARNVEKRSLFPPEKRFDVSPWDTQDVPNDQQLRPYDSGPSQAIDPAEYRGWHKPSMTSFYDRSQSAKASPNFTSEEKGLLSGMQDTWPDQWNDAQKGVAEKMLTHPDTVPPKTLTPAAQAQEDAFSQYTDAAKARAAATEQTGLVSGADANARIDALNPNGLNMGARARAIRAKDTGFGADTYYHGTEGGDFSSFKLPDAGDVDRPEAATFFTKNPGIAGIYAGEEGSVGPYKLRMANPRVVDFKSAPGADPILDGINTDMGHASPIGRQIASEVIKRAADQGHDSVIMKNVLDLAGGDNSGNTTRYQTHVAVLDPKNIRSKYAVFDPLRRDSSDLMAAGGLGVAPVAGKNEFDDPKYSIAPTATSAPKEPRNEFDDPAFSVPPPSTGQEQPQGALGYINAGARAAANAATFGGADRAANLIHQLAGTPGDEMKNTAIARKDYPYTSLGGEVAGGALPALAGGVGVARAIPALGRATLRSIAGNGAVVGAGMAAATDASKGETDPYKYGTDAAIGGVGGGLLGGAVGAVTKALPLGKIRAVGASIPRAHIDDAAEFAQRSGAAGVPVTVPEAMRAVHPEHSGEVESVYNSAVRSPAGSQSAAGFEAGRSPLIDVAARRAAASMGPEISPVDASNAARGAITEAKNTINNSSEPYYTRAQRVMMDPPETQPAAVAHVAARELGRNQIRLGDLSNTTGKPVAAQPGVDSVRRDLSALGPRPEDAPAPIPGGGETANSNVPQPPDQIPLAAVDHVRHQLGTLYERAATDDPRTAALIARGRDALTDSMETASPAFRQGLDIERRGNAQLMDHLNAGPLGTIAATNSPAAQSTALFGARTPLDANAAIRAASRMSGIAEREGVQDPSLGLLSGHLRRAVSDGPGGFARALPSDASMDVASSVAGPRMAPVASTIDALRALKPTTLPPTDELHGYGVSGMMFRAARDLGKGKVAGLMQDPSNIPLLGTVGRGTRNSLAALLSAMNDSRSR